MRELRDYGRHGRLLLSAALFLTVAAPACGGGGGGGAGSQFCNEWAAAFCHRIWACDPANNPFAGPSEAECASGYAMLCSQPQPAGQTFDVSCAGGKQVNQAAKTACLNKLNTVSCDEFNGATYADDCGLVCTAGTGGTGGTGGAGGTGGTSGGGCGTVQPCGGDLVGTWSISQVCVNGTAMGDPNCPGDTISNISATETGTLTFASGGTYTTNLSTTISYTEMFPQSCYDPLTCADFASLGAGTCTGSTACTCNFAIAANGAEAGTFTTAGTAVTVTDSSTGAPRAMGYCVQGNSVHFMHFNSAGQVTTEEVAQRQ